jgi:diacylglycerol kinase (ATP)
VVRGRRPDLRGDRTALSGDSANGRVFVIFNPASGRGRGGRRIAAYLELLERYVPGHAHCVTTRPGEEADLAERAVEEGYDTVVAVGGDGTWSHVADRLVETGRDVRFALLPSGTGNDFGRNLGLDYGDPEQAVRALAAGKVRRVDVGRVLTPLRSAEQPGSPILDRRHFLNLVGFGFDIAVIDAARGARFLKGEILYKLTAFQELFRFPGIELALRGGGGFERTGRHLMLTISNGPFFGGGFPIAPGAAPDDGLLHACAIGDAGPLNRASLFSAAGKGRHIESPRVEVASDRSFRIEFPQVPRFEVDGDVFTTESRVLEVEVVPGALQVVRG